MNMYGKKCVKTDRIFSVLFIIYNILVINDIKINICILRRFAVKQKCSLSEHLYFFGTLIIG